MVSFIYACALFVILMLLNDRIHLGKISQGLADMSYSIYLLHGSIGLFLLSYLNPLMGYTPSLILTILIVLLACYVQFKLIEQPSQYVAKKILSNKPQGSLT